MFTRHGARWCAAAVLVFALAPTSNAQTTPGAVLSEQKISATQGGFSGTLDSGDRFGSAVGVLGDVDGDGIDDIAVGAVFDDDGAVDAGALWILFLNTDGTVKAEQKISALEGGFAGPLKIGDAFGGGVSTLGDLDGDGVLDIAVTATLDDDGGLNAGAVWILFLNADGTVKTAQKISALEGGFVGPLSSSDQFGHGVAQIGDLDEDGVVDLAVGAVFDVDGNGLRTGSLWILFLNPNGTVKASQRINSTDGGFTGILGFDDRFSRNPEYLGDLDGDGVGDVAVGARVDDDGAIDAGAVWILFLNPTGTVKAHQKISATQGGFTGTLDADDSFGVSSAYLGDVDGDGVGDLAVGAVSDDDGAQNAGAMWVLFLNSDGTVKGHQKISMLQGGLTGPLGLGDFFGVSSAAFGDFDGDGIGDMLVGANADGDGALGAGAVWVLFLDGVLPSQGPASTPFIGAMEGRGERPAIGFPPAPLTGEDEFIPKPFVVGPKVNTGTVEIQVATVGEGGQTVSFASPDPGFGSEFATGAQPVMAVQADFDEDTGDDILTANKAGNSVSLLLSDDIPGNPAFGPQQEIPLGFDTEPVAVRAAELGGVLHLDFAVAGKEGVTVFLASAPATFGSGAFTQVDKNGLELEAFHTDLDTGDYDGDGDVDLVTASGTQAIPGPPLAEEGWVTVLENVGGAFSVKTTLDVGDQAVASVLMGDFDNTDGNGDDDLLVVVHQYDGGPGGEPQADLRLYRSNGDGTFTLSAGAFGDDDGDGIDDNLSYDADGIVPTFGAKGDIDLDGDLDAVFTSREHVAYPAGAFGSEYPPVQVTLLKNNGSGGFTVSHIGTAYAGTGISPILQDVAGLGGPFLDLVLLWFQDQGTGMGGAPVEKTFVTALMWEPLLGTFVDASPNQFLSGDEPGEGDAGDVVEDPGADAEVPAFVVGPPIEFVVPNMKGNSLSLFASDGAGGLALMSQVANVDSFDPELTYPSGTWEGGPRQVQLGDVDGDGHLDAVVYVSWDDILLGSSSVVPTNVVVLRGDGTGAWGLPQSLGPPLSMGGEMAVGDLDGDGRDDVVLTQRLGQGGQQILGFSGGPGGVLSPMFTVTEPFGSAVLAGGIALMDADYDGQTDVVLGGTKGSITGKAHLIVLSDFTGQPVDPRMDVLQLTSKWGSLRNLDVGDVNGDSSPDILVGAESGALYLLTGDPAQQNLAFEETPLGEQAAAVGGGAIRLGDVTGDGVLDILSSGVSNANQQDQAFVRSLRGTGNGDFDVQVVDGLSSHGVKGALRPMLADVNGDGALDTVLTHGGPAGTISVQLNPLNGFTAGVPGHAGPGVPVPTLKGYGYTTPGGWFELVADQVLGGAFVVLMPGWNGAQDVNAVLTGIGGVGLPFVVPGPPGQPTSWTWSATLPVDYDLVGLETTLRLFVVARLGSRDGGGGQGVSSHRPTGAGATVSQKQPILPPGGPILAPGVMSSASSNTLRLRVVDGN